MKQKKYIFFDLDGTLTDPKEGITKGIEYSLKKLGIEIESRDELLAFIGPPLKQSYCKFFGLDEREAERAIEFYREYYAEKGIYENNLYEGITDLLRKLCEGGKILAVATSKPTVFASRVLEYFSIDRYFSFVAGSELDGRRTVKGEVIKFAMDAIKLENAADAVMVGDREHDIIGAKENNMENIGVLYGYGDFAELNAAKADLIVPDIQSLLKVLNG